MDGDREARAATMYGAAAVAMALVAAVARSGMPFFVGGLAGLVLGVVAVWSAVKSWLHSLHLHPVAALGFALGMTAMIVVMLLGPCGEGGCGVPVR